MHSRYIQFVTTAFERDSAFVEAIDKACRTVVNTKLKGGSSSKVGTGAGILAEEGLFVWL